MYTVEFYKDKNGKSEISDYFYELVRKSKTDKNAKINKNKIFSYSELLGYK